MKSDFNRNKSNSDQLKVNLDAVEKSVGINLKMNDQLMEKKVVEAMEPGFHK